ncbi:diaminopimelate epimerase [Propionibacteriaceae bacterium Y1685]|uniref:diaminopimelate epimerase n=1 Tax=Microlunatus sp. Y1700 TaxID=3418487 RepID=UPI003B7BE552
MRTWNFVKGHGTENDFVILLDRHGMIDPTPAEVRFLCDRRAGIGADGVMRATWAKHISDWDGDPDIWFMDYRNADGSVAEMCGNGSRAFARFLLDQGLADGPELRIGTRNGVRDITVRPDGQFTVAMGVVTLGEEATVRVADLERPAGFAEVGNPHAVAVFDKYTDLAGFDLFHTPHWRPAGQADWIEAKQFPEGTNVELVVPVGERHVAMRVYERGVGETRSCGTGTVGVAAVMGADIAEEHDWRIDVPGGTVHVHLGPATAGARESWLTGPAVMVAHGEVTVPDDLS